MQIKKFQAINMKEALKMVKNDLGADAIILSSRTINTNENDYGLMDKSLIEVVAAVDRNFERNPIRQVLKIDEYPDQNDNFMTERSHSLPKNNLLDTKSVESAVLTLKEDFHSIIENNSSQFSSQINLLKTELNDIKWLLKGIFHEDTLTDETFDNNPFACAFRRLFLNGIDKLLSAQIIDSVRENTPDEYINNPEIIFENVRKELKRLISINYDEDSNRTIVIALVGPTGVGKTTTLAKIAAKKTIEEKKNVGIITLDTFRIGAVEQLKTYAQIINVPIKVAKNNSELKQALNSLKSKDIIMIDTVGHSQKNIKQIKKLQETFDFNPIIENHLVLSCSTKEQDQFDIINTFDILKIDSLIFTKTDETNELGSIFNISAKTGKPISYITNGQNVPEDIIKATKENVVALIFNEDAVNAL